MATRVNGFTVAQYEMIRGLLLPVGKQTNTEWSEMSAVCEENGRRVYRLVVNGICIAAYRAALQKCPSIFFVQKDELVGAFRDTAGNDAAVSRIPDGMFPDCLRRRRLPNFLQYPTIHMQIPIVEHDVAPGTLFVAVCGLRVETPSRFSVVLVAEAAPPRVAKTLYVPPNIQTVFGKLDKSGASEWGTRMRMSLTNAKSGLLDGTVLEEHSLMVPQFESERYAKDHMIRYLGANDIDTEFTKEEKAAYIASITSLKLRNDQDLMLGRNPKVIADLLALTPKVSQLCAKVCALARALRKKGVWCVAYWSGGKGFRLLVASQELFCYVADNADFKEVAVNLILPHFFRYLTAAWSVVYILTIDTRF
jgi:hypothetical protein